jgi:hypothetical protein
MAQRAQAYVAEVYSVPAMVAGYQELYAALLRGRR